MTEVTDDLLSMSIGADDYAEAAAGDVPSVPRTFQSESDFQAQKAAYVAKFSHGNNRGVFLTACPELASDVSPQDRLSLSKKHIQLLGYAIGEMYFDGQYSEILDLCNLIQTRCEMEPKLSVALQRWTNRCNDRIHRQQSEGPVR